MTSEKQKMLAGLPYLADSPELNADRAVCAATLARYNQLVTVGEQQVFLEELVGSAGTRTLIRPPFFCDYGYNIHLGADVFLNFNCVILDVASVHIGDHTKIGSAVQILTAD